MKTIKIAVKDFEYGTNQENNFIVNILKKKYDVIFSDNPDFLIYSIWGNEHKKYDCVKIFYTGEPVSPNFNDCDYAIGFDFIDFEDRYLRLPLFAMQMDRSIQEREKFVAQDISHKKFCNFIYNNETVGEGAIIRKSFCKKLMEYKKVDCPGSVLHNMDSSLLSSRFANDWYQSKLKFLNNYRFTIAFENTLTNGYTTEKLIQPFIAGSIPIYFGNSKVVKDFNPKAFINSADYEYDFDRIITRISEIEENEENVRSMLLEKPLQSDYWFFWKEHLASFMDNIIQKGNKPYHKHKEKEVKDENFIQGSNNKFIYESAIISELKKYEKIYIYGDGLFGRMIGEQLIQCRNINVIAYLVTKTNNEQNKLFQKPVISIDEVKLDKNALILVAIREESQQALIQELRVKGWNNIIAVNPFLIKILGKS